MNGSWILSFAQCVHFTGAFRNFNYAAGCAEVGCTASRTARVARADLEVFLVPAKFHLTDFHGVLDDAGNRIVLSQIEHLS